MKKVTFFKLFAYARGLDYLYIFIGSIAAAINGATLPLMTVFFGDIIQSFVMYNGSPESQIVLDNGVRDGVIKMCLLGGLTFIVSYLQMACWMLTGENQSYRIKLAYFEAILRQDVGWFDEHNTGDLTNRLSSDMSLIQEGISDKVGLLIQFTTAFIAGFVIAFIKGWRLAIVLSGSLPLLAGSAFVMSKVLAGDSGEEQDAYAEAGDVAQQVLSSMRTVAAFAGEEKEIKRYGNCLDKAEKVGIKKAFYNGIGIGTIQALMFFLYGLAFGYGNTLIPDVMNAGEVLNVFFAIVIGAFSLGNASPHIGAIGTALGAATKVFDTIGRVSPIDPLSSRGDRPTSIEGSVEFKDIDFHYPSRDDVPILKKFSLNVKPGTTVALVGSSGSGKSTIVKLLERFYDPVSGTVSLDGKDIKDLNVTWLRQQIGMVSQEPTLFDATIKENILLGYENSNNLPDGKLLELVQEACVKANCWEFIDRLPLKLDTKVGEGGSMLSGGQKQRIAIARAIIKDPKILLLDEATSALDTESERIVQAALENASKNRTTIVIAHRLSTVKNADMIVVMNTGVIVENGTHQELVEKKGVYFSLVQGQNIKQVDDTTEEKVELEPSKSQTSLRKRNSTPKRQNLEVPDEDEEAEVAKQTAEKLKSIKLDYSRLLAWNRPEYPIFVLASLGSIVNGASQPLFSILFSNVLTVLGTSTAVTYAWLFCGLAVVAFISNFLQIGLFKYAGEKMTRRVRYLCFATLLRQEIGFFDLEENATGSLTSKLAEEASLVQGLTGQTFGAIAQAIAGIAVGLTIAFISSWQLSLVVIGMVPLIGFAGFLQLQSLTGFGGKSRKAYAAVGQLSTEVIQSIRTIVTLTKERHFFQSFSEKLIIPHEITIKGAIISSFAFGFSQSILHFAWAASFYYGSRLVSWGLYDTGAVFRAIFAIIFTAMASGQVANFTPDAAKAKLAAASIFELLDRKSKIDYTIEEGDKKDTTEGSVKIEGATFSYPSRPDTLILKGLTLSAKPGMTVALVGRSGCGKSTVMALLQRWYDPENGLVAYEDLAINKWNLRNLRTHMAIVGQEPVLFNTTIRDNIAYGALSEPLDSTIEAAAKLANIHDFIMTLPDKYQSMVGEKGGKMSGGQKQRIAIARALIRNPRLLLLDEATSALDSESEIVVQEALDKAAKDRTTLVIAHRLSTIQNADLILVVDQGQVVESGTHEQLIKQGRIYYELSNQQRLK
ncbi:P-loop containing nucleoside triphosphate hydrolase protein [Globomyces pollinis-pini]|nr:P-loop containing nucleoside triphosphate hydrolase protein [Globomyces pollinis-pini]